MRLVLVGILALLPTPAWGQAAPSGCDSPEGRQFDFWVGRWVVSRAAKPDEKIADSLIEKLYAGCAVRESWAPLSGGGGGSLNSYVPAEKRWRQTWVGSGGERVDFAGGWNGKAMVLEGAWPGPKQPTRRIRMTFTPNPDGSVRQFGEESDDGRTWKPNFDLIYRPAPG